MCVNCCCLPSALFVSGESYAGIYVPTLAWNIMTKENSINMKGFMVGHMTYTHTHRQIHTHTCTHARMHTHTHTCTYRQTHAHAHTHRHTHTHAHTDRYTHTHTHAHTDRYTHTHTHTDTHRHIVCGIFVVRFELVLHSHTLIYVGWKWLLWQPSRCMLTFSLQV